MTVATVLVVRPRAQALGWVAQLEAAGVAAHALPLIDILPAPDPAAVVAVFADVVRADGEEPVLVFVSPNAVDGFFAAAGAPAWPDGATAAATGPGTVAALRAAGVPEAAIVAPPASSGQFDSEALWARIRGWRWPGRPVWLVRGNGGREWLGERLRAAGARVEVVQAYGRAEPALGEDERALLAAALAEPARWVWMFSSSEAIGHLEALAPGADWRAARALASHPRIAERAQALGFGDVAVVSPLPAAVAEAVRALPASR
jgi:uroporphyrinogen-III synthase